MEHKVIADLAENAPVIIAFHGLDHNILWANAAYQKATGLSLQEMEGQQCYSVWRLAKLCRNCPVTTAIETGEPAEAELTPRNQDHWPDTQGSWLSKAAPIRDDDGALIGAVEVAYDITKRTESEEALAAANEQLVVGNQQLRATEQQLRAANQQLTAGNQQIRATEQQLRAANQQLEAANAQLRATEQQLRAANQQLAAGNQQLRATEQQLRAANQQLEAANRQLTATGEKLRERVKELTCLYNIAKLFARPGVPLDEVLQGAADLIPPSWQYPDATCARITLDRREFSTPNFRETDWGQTAAILVGGEPAGSVEVCHLREKPEEAEGPFLPEERDLLAAAAALLGPIIERARAEEALRASRDYLEKLTNSMWDAVFSVKMPERIVEWANDSFSLIGYAPEECFGRTTEFLYPDEKEFLDFGSKLRAVIAEGKDILHAEQQLRRKDGNVFPAEITTTVYRKQGEVVRVTSIVRDVTERKQAEEALRRSEARYRARVEDSPAITYTAALDEASTTTYVSPQIESMLGVSPDDYRADPDMWRKLLHPDDRERVMKEVARSDETGQPLVCEYRMRGPEGREVWFHDEARIVTDADGNPEYLLGVMYDITERRRAEEALRESEGKLAAIVRSIPDHMSIMDNDLNIIWANETARRVFGDDIVGKKCYQAYHGRQQPCEPHPCLTLRAFQDGKAHEHDTEVTAKNGEVLHFHCTANVCTRDEHGNPTGVMEISRNVTAQRELEEQLRQSQKMEAVGQLAGGIAHDFNNLLQAILGYAEILKLQAEPRSQQYEDLRTIEQAAQRAAALTAQLLGFARKGQFQLIPVDVHQTVHEVVALLQRTLDKNIRVTIDLAAADATIEGDPGQLQQIFMNLGINARDAMAEGGDLAIRSELVDLDEAYCRMHPETKPGRYVMVLVSDTGCGMPEEVRGRVFEPFFTTKQIGRGTGMGLAMVYGIVKQHGGTIEVYSEEGRGTTFRVYLPLAEEAAAEAVAARPGEPVRGTGHILVVDDEETVRKMASRLLENLGYTVHAVWGGKEAVEYYRERGDEIDLVIIDLIMPEMDGRETFRALKEIDPGVKAILCSGYDRNERTQAVIDEGLLGFVQKPYSRQELSEAVARALKG